MNMVVVAVDDHLVMIMVIVPLLHIVILHGSVRADKDGLLVHSFGMLHRRFYGSIIRGTVTDPNTADLEKRIERIPGIPLKRWSSYNSSD